MSAGLALVDIAVDGAAIVEALRDQMRSLRELVEGLPEHSFRAAPSGSSGTIGEHVRHCLDHIRTLASAVDAEEISYDSRLRGTAVETHPDAAVDAFDQLLASLDGFDDEMLGRSLVLRTMPCRGSAPVRVRTTVAREAAFVVQHTIHHCATMAVLLERLRVSVPPDFGYAPSTPQPRLP